MGTQWVRKSKKTLILINVFFFLYCLQVANVLEDTILSGLNMVATYHNKIYLVLAALLQGEQLFATSFSRDFPLTFCYKVKKTFLASL